MQSVWDWASLAVFAGLAVLYLQRSVDETGAKDRIVDYLPPAIGCAIANYLGNHGYGLVAILLLAAAVAHIVFILKPFPWRH
jgi:uncharacterized membrane protein YjjP (DUF1212 family)